MAVRFDLSIFYMAAAQRALGLLVGSRLIFSCDLDCSIKGPGSFEGWADP